MIDLPLNYLITASNRVPWADCLRPGSHAPPLDGGCEGPIEPHGYSREERENPSKLKWACYGEWMLERQSTNIQLTPSNHLENAQKEPGSRKCLAKGLSSPNSGKIKPMTS